MAIPLGLVNAPATIQGHIFRDMLDQGMLAFMDGLVVHAKTGEDPGEIVLEELRLCEGGKALD